MDQLSMNHVEGDRIDLGLNNCEHNCSDITEEQEVGGLLTEYSIDSHDGDNLFDNIVLKNSSIESLQISEKKNKNLGMGTMVLYVLTIDAWFIDEV